MRVSRRRTALDRIEQATRPRTPLPASPVAPPVSPSCRVYKATGQSIPNGALTVLTFDSERFDTLAMHSTVTNTSRLIAPEAGIYLITGYIFWPPKAVGERWIGVRLNGGEAKYIVADRRNPAASGDAEQTLSLTWQMAVNDYVELVAYQTSGGALLTETAGLFLAPQEFGLSRIA